jgi:putative GTP pyrophosphokinase
MKVGYSKSEKKLIDGLVDHYLQHRGLISTFGNSVRLALTDSDSLRPFIHSMRFRIKDPAHLKDKLLRKLKKSKEDGVAFEITKNNLFTIITDLTGIRLLHLHTTQFADINRCFKEIIDEQPIDLIEGPFARTWDDEYRGFFRSLGVDTQVSETMYTSVHYVVSSKMKTSMTCEIQVRTLMEEVWGEVDHAINYPHPVESVGCKEQIRALARATSSATRLVDAIFATYVDYKHKSRSHRRLHEKGRNETLCAVKLWSFLGAELLSCRWRCPSFPCGGLTPAAELFAHNTGNSIHVATDHYHNVHCASLRGRGQPRTCVLAAGMGRHTPGYRYATRTVSRS